MFFKNARMFRFTRPVAIKPEDLEAMLAEDAFKPCGPQEVSRQGWVPPLGKHSDQLVHAANGCLLICLQRQEKILPGPVVKEFVEERCEAIEVEQGRKVRRKEKDEIREQVLLETLPHAFPRNKRTFAYLNPAEGYMVVDAATAKAAEDLASTLRKSLGSLPVRPIAMEQSPAFTFTGWLSESIEPPVTIVFGTDCWLEDPSEDGGKVTARGVDLKSEEVRNHLEASMQVTRLAMTWDDNVSFMLDEDLGITRLKFGETLHEQLDDIDADDAAAKFDAAFSLMTLEFSRMIPELLEALGGEDRSAIVEDEPMSRRAQAPSPELVDKIKAPHKEQDPLYPEASQLAIESQRASISTIQRKLRVGYNRACHLMEALEDASVVSRANHSGMREVLIQIEAGV